MTLATYCNSTNPVYRVWNAMIKRCEYPKAKSYEYVGARGIKVCEEWRRNFRAFERWCLANGYEHGLYLDREDNDKDYEPGNCRFITPAASARNRRSNVLLTAWGEKKHQQDWISDPRCLVDMVTLRGRLAKGMGHEEAMTLKIPSGRFGGYIEAWGEKKGVIEWTKDPRCIATREQIKSRLRADIPAEAAMSYGNGYRIVRGLAGACLVQTPGAKFKQMQETRS